MLRSIIFWIIRMYQSNYWIYTIQNYTLSWVYDWVKHLIVWVRVCINKSVQNKSLAKSRIFDDWLIHKWQNMPSNTSIIYTYLCMYGKPCCKLYRKKFNAHLHAKMRTHVILNALIARISCAGYFARLFKSIRPRIVLIVHTHHWQENLHNIIKFCGTYWLILILAGKILNKVVNVTIIIPMTELIRIYS
jgi:hypothetical protein